MVKTKKQRISRVSQGDIIRNVEHIEYVASKNGVLEISKIEFPLVVVLTQDCDLAQDYKFRWAKPEASTQDKYLMSVLVAPLYNLEHVFTGEHLTDVGLKMATINKTKSPGTNLVNNETPRFHTLKFGSDVQIVDSVVDFKHYFSINVEYIKKHKQKNFVCQLSALFREDLSQRFASYLSRIGLP